MRIRLDQARIGDRLVLYSPTGTRTSHPVTERQRLDDGRLRIVTPAGATAGPPDIAITVSRKESKQ